MDGRKDERTDMLIIESRGWDWGARVWDVRCELDIDIGFEFGYR